MIGDLHQLPPVVKPEDWDMLSRYYETPFFFSSLALQQTDYIAVELKHIFRQSDPEFIGLLNKVRDNRLDEESLRKLNTRFIAGFQPPSNEAYITLTATNAAANEINAGNLARLQGTEQVFRATIEGEFPPSAYPTEETLKFKVGAQVMFIKNDTESERKYFNGKIGRITKIEDEFIFVQCPNDPLAIAVATADWQNTKYSLNEETKQIEEEVLGMFVQYPLKLAWAITIHKSQGLTFERAIIDAQAAFASGQVYVALSRCKSFEGIVLRSRIGVSSVKTDSRVKHYTAEAERNLPSEPQLQQAKREFQSTVLQELFRFDVAAERMERLRFTYAEHANSLPPLALDQLQSLAEQARADLFEVCRRFAPQLAEYLAQDVMPDANEALQARIKKASTYFTEKITGLMQGAGQLSTEADNQDVAATLVSQLDSLQLALFVKRGCFAACGEGFKTEVYNRAKVDAELDYTKSRSASPKQTVVPKGISHPELYRQLLQWRHEAAERDGDTVSRVLPNRTLKELVTHLPTDKSRLRHIHGIGKARLQRYGRELCNLIQKFRSEHKIAASETAEPKPERQSSAASETKRHSLALFQSGKSLDEIATERRLARSTIEGHLSHFIGVGELDVHAILDRETVDTIQRFLKSQPEAVIADVKSHFGDKYSYGVLKMVMSHMLKNQSR